MQDTEFPGEVLRVGIYFYDEVEFLYFLSSYLNVSNRLDYDSNLVMINLKCYFIIYDFIIYVAIIETSQRWISTVHVFVRLFSGLICLLNDFVRVLFSCIFSEIIIFLDTCCIVHLAVLTSGFVNKNLFIRFVRKTDYAFGTYFTDNKCTVKHYINFQAYENRRRTL